MSTQPNPASNTASAEEIRRDMAKLRCQLREDFDGTAAQAKELTDWKHYVRQAPWAAFGAAAVAGFALVPRQLRVATVDAKAAAALANQNRVVVRGKGQPEGKSSLGGFLLRTGMTMALRTVIGIATQKATQFGVAQQHNSTTNSNNTQAERKTS